MTTTYREGGSEDGPTVLRMLLGSQLRQLREKKGVSRSAAGWEIRGSESKISRMELGKVGFKERDVKDLLTLYGVTDEDQRAALLSLAREANTPGWWHRFNDILPNWFEPYLGLESAANRIRTYEVQFVPGLLQTADYARAVIQLGHGSAPADEIDRRVAIRLERQRILARNDPPRLWAVVDEGALRRPIGGPHVMRDQMLALIEHTKRSDIRLQVLPFEAGGHAAAGGPFTLLRFPEQDLPDIVYLEQLTSALYLDKREHVEPYLAAMEQVCVDARPLAETPDILHSMLRDFDDAAG